MIVTITSMDTLVGGGVKSYVFFNVHWERWFPTWRVCFGGCLKPPCSPWICAPIFRLMFFLATRISEDSEKCFLLQDRTFRYFRTSCSYTDVFYFRNKFIGIWVNPWGFTHCVRIPMHLTTCWIADLHRCEMLVKCTHRIHVPWESRQRQTRWIVMVITIRLTFILHFYYFLMWFQHPKNPKTSRSSRIEVSNPIPDE